MQAARPTPSRARVTSLRDALVALVLTIVSLHAYVGSASGQPDNVVFHDEDGYEVSFRANGTFTAVCRCVSPSPSALMCSKMFRALVALKSGDRDAGIMDWELYGTMRSGARFDLRQACFLDRSDSQYCCTGGSDGTDEDWKRFYHAELKSVAPD